MEGWQLQSKKVQVRASGMWTHRIVLLLRLWRWWLVGLLGSTPVAYRHSKHLSWSLEVKEWAWVTVLITRESSLQDRTKSEGWLRYLKSSNQYSRVWFNKVPILATLLSKRLRSCFWVQEEAGPPQRSPQSSTLATIPSAQKKKTNCPPLWLTESRDFNL